jgi:hypothetical protein
MSRTRFYLAAVTFGLVACAPTPVPDLGIRATPSPSDVAASPALAAGIAPSPTPTPPPPAEGQGLSQFDTTFATLADGSTPDDWQDVTGPSWLNHDAWPIRGGIWQLPTFNGSQYAFRRYAGGAFQGDGQVPDLYQVEYRIRPTGSGGSIAVCPYYLSPTQYCLVRIDLGAKNVSLWEIDGATPTSGESGTLDLSQNHRGWRPLPAPDSDGAYPIRVRVNTTFHSLALWVDKTWIDNPLVPSVTARPHGIAIRTSGHPQEVLAVSVTTYTDPMKAR